MTSPRPNAELAAKYYSDTENKCWVWFECWQKWELEPYPTFCDDYTYYVGKEHPKGVVCVLGGKVFPKPVEVCTEDKDKKYWIPNVSAPSAPFSFTLDINYKDKRWVTSGMVHEHPRHAEQHAYALQAATARAVHISEEGGYTDD